MVRLRGWRLGRGKKRASAEERLALQLKVAKLPAPERQYKPAEDWGRAWRIDFAWPMLRLAIEVEEDVHQIHRRAIEDTERTLALQALGWTVVKFHHSMVDSGLAFRWIRAELAERALYPVDVAGDLIEVLARHGILKARKEGG